MSLSDREAALLMQRVAYLERMVAQLMQPKSVGRLVIPEIGGKIYLTPSGGIDALTGTSTPWTPGVASCTLCEYYNDSGTIKIRTTSTSENVYNMVDSDVAGDTLIQAKIISGKPTADVEPCGG